MRKHLIKASRIRKYQQKSQITGEREFTKKIEEVYNATEYNEEYWIWDSNPVSLITSLLQYKITPQSSHLLIQQKRFPYYITWGIPLLQKVGVNREYFVT